MSNAISPQLLTSHKLYFEITSQTQSIAHASSRLFSGRIPELEWAAEIEPTTKFQVKIKEALHISWEQPSLNKQLYHVNLTLSF